MTVIIHETPAHSFWRPNLKIYVRRRKCGQIRVFIRRGSRSWGGGGGFRKKFSRTFFRSTKLIFWALPNQYKDPILTKLFVPQASFSKNFIMHFLEIFDQKIALSPSKLVYIDAKGAFQKMFRSVIQNWISQNSTRGTLWVGRGFRIAEGGAHPRKTPSIKP